MTEFTHEPHRFVKHKRLQWPMCVRCGLVGLNNSFTRWCVDKGCNSTKHPSYAMARSRYTALIKEQKK